MSSKREPSAEWQQSFFQTIMAHHDKQESELLVELGKEIRSFVKDEIASQQTETNELLAAIRDLIVTMAQPKRLVFDAEGKPVGVAVGKSLSN
ncbi:hypothetical protein ACRQ5Q_18580 [Bradyrhizobium sp. PMVTL-01]|uniref:hypothetical protein n=1 Tax=Bradyrhizobium sp. PMVTL-01 TaxID=3434999 RepID=UPI003F70C5EA